MSGRADIRGIRGDTRAVVAELLGEGWRIERWTGASHLLLRHDATGAAITASCSASDRHARHALRRTARRALAQAAARRAQA